MWAAVRTGVVELEVVFLEVGVAEVALPRVRPVRRREALVDHRHVPRTVGTGAVIEEPAHDVLRSSSTTHGHQPYEALRNSTIAVTNAGSRTAPR